MTGALLSVVVAAILNAGTSYVFKLIVNAANALARGGAPSDLWYAIIAYIVVSTVSTLAWRSSGFIGMHWTTGVRATARYSLSSYVTLHSHEYFSNRFAGSILSKISNAAGSTKDMCEQILWQFTGFIVTMIASLVIIFQSSTTLALIFLAWIALITPLNLYFARKRVPLSAAGQKAETALGGATVDMLTNISAVYEYARRPFELGRLKELITTRRTAGLRNWRYGESVLLLNGILQTLFIGALLLTAVRLTVTGVISPGDIALILTLILIVEDRLTFIGQQINNFADAWGQVSESLDDILVSQDVSNAAGAKTLPVSNGAIAFQKIDFTYGGAPVFKQLELDIPGGQKVGLVGRSGAGKSTLIKLLLRHYDLTGGRITIDGTSIADVTKESLRGQIAVVPQEPLLFHRTIRENIAYGRIDASEEDIVRAATLAEAHQFITQLTDGYNSLVGERGVKLSGGQRQRIVIARALLKNSRVLLLDEATSSLDSESEIAVQKALLTLMEQRTVIAIAHRLSTLRAMDRIIVMDKGAIIEDGSHEELLAREGLYATLWNHQAGGFLEE
jgi:ATP-binding cassette subfamily B protein